MTNKEWLMQGDNLEKALDRVNLAFDQIVFSSDVNNVPDCLLEELLGWPPYPNCPETEGYYGEPVVGSCEECIRKWLKKDFIERMNV